MQLSYKDAIHDYYKTTSCKEINYAKKNITDPAINLSCAMDIMTVILNRRDGNVMNLGAYWAVMRSTNLRYSVTKNKLYEEMPECDPDYVAQKH